jgi:predicted AAA+ superfamily ATPase
LTEEPALVLNGPRTVGKSTLLHALGDRLGRPVIDCDDPATRAAVRADPGRFVSGPAPILIDEYQHVPDLLSAIKAELNRDLSPGRFVLAGSTRYTTLPEAGQALTGRVDILEVLPLTQAEIDGATGGFMVSRLLDGAGTRVDRSDLAGIRALRARLGKRLATAVVLYTGALTFRFDDGTLVLPLDALWSKTL